MGNIVCNASLPANSKYKDCKPLNLFGRGNASKEAIDWVTGFDPGVQVTTITVPAGLSALHVQLHRRRVQAPADRDRTAVRGSHRERQARRRLGRTDLHGDRRDHRKESLDQRVQASQGNPQDPLCSTVVAENNPALNIRGVPVGASGNSVETQFSKVPLRAVRTTSRSCSLKDSCRSLVARAG